MPIGKVIWFGGSTKEGRKNDFGFLSFINEETGKEEEVYVNRRDIPKDLQNLFENAPEQGKGIYVQFDLDTNGKTKAINIKLHKTIGTVIWFSNGRGYINCENIDNDIYISSDSQYSQNDILFFGIRENTRKRKEEAIDVKKCTPVANEQEIINHCVNSSVFEIYYPFLLNYISTISQEEAINFIFSKIESASSIHQQKILIKLQESVEHLFLASSELRKLLSTSTIKYANLLNKYLTSGKPSLQKMLLQELLLHLKTCSEDEEKIIWNNVRFLEDNLDYRGSFWDIAPFEYKKKLIQNRYSDFFEIIAQFKNSNYPYAGGIRQQWRKLYQFNELDKQLIQEWSPNVFKQEKEFERATMLSARGAEKLVIDFYKGLENKVEDVSIHQVTQKSKDWIKGDIQINSTDLLDVKNARTTVNSKFYSEFCVPKFKTNRSKDVKIVAVLSPYLQSKYMEGEKAGFLVDPDPTFLGEFNYSQMVELNKIFSDSIDSISQLDMSRGFDPKNYLAPWVFDYNDQFYSEQIEISERFKQLENRQIPCYEDIQLVSDNSIHSFLFIFIFANKPIPNSWKQNLPNWLINLLQTLTRSSGNRLTLPYLFLCLLKHFLTMLSYQGNDYSPKSYKAILFDSGSPNHPLKIYDPLGIINDFCDTLQIVWEHRQKANLTQFKVFKFNGRGLLQGKRTKNDSIQNTILAYCGGWIDGKGKCGFTPLVIGKHQNCPSCGKLICPKEDCGYCSDNCESYLKRKQNNQYSNYSRRQEVDDFLFDDNEIFVF